MTAAPNRSVQRILKCSMVATAAYVGLTFAFGLRVHSLALLSESGHNLSDLAAIGLSSLALHFQSRPATEEKTFGYGRAGVLAAFVNALSLLAIALWIIFDAMLRLRAPVAVQPNVMMLVATAGVVMNGIIAALLWRFSGEVNIRSVFIHMLGDTVSTAAVILGGFFIVFTHKTWIDPVLSLLIAGLILWSSIGIVRETLHILLEGTPRNLSLPEVRSAISGVSGVVDVHDLHIWNVGPNSLALVSHITITEMPLAQCTALLDSVNRELLTRFRIRHTTLQLESTTCAHSGVCCNSLLEAEQPHDHDGHDHHHGIFGHAH